MRFKPRRIYKEITSNFPRTNYDWPPILAKLCAEVTFTPWWPYRIVPLVLAMNHQRTTQRSYIDDFVVSQPLATSALRIFQPFNTLLLRLALLQLLSLGIFEIPTSGYRIHALVSWCKSSTNSTIRIPTCESLKLSSHFDKFSLKFAIWCPKADVIYSTFIF